MNHHSLEIVKYAHSACVLTYSTSFLNWKTITVTDIQLNSLRSGILSSFLSVVY